MTIDKEKIRAAAMAATQGEWVANENGAVRTVSGDESTRGRARWQGVFRQVDANHIATSNPSTVLSLLEALDKAEKDAERYRWLRDSQGGKEVRIMFRNEWDTSIDAAIEQAKGAEGAEE